MRRRNGTFDGGVKAPRRTFSFHNFTAPLGTITGKVEQLAAGTKKFFGGVLEFAEPEDMRCNGHCMPGPKMKANVVCALAKACLWCELC